MGWIAFLLHRFAHGLDSLFIFEFWAASEWHGQRPLSSSWPGCSKMEEPCALWLLLLKKFAIGKLSATEVQEIALAATKSGAKCGFLVQLQAIGSMGQAPGNCHRGLIRLDRLLIFFTGR